MVRRKQCHLTVCLYSLDLEEQFFEGKSFRKKEGLENGRSLEKNIFVWFHTKVGVSYFMPSFVKLAGIEFEVVKKLFPLTRNNSSHLKKED